MKTKVYLASPFFNDAELKNVKRTEKILIDKGFDLFSPRKIEVSKEKYSNDIWANKIFEKDREAIKVSDIVVALYYGMYTDTGTAWEIGFAYGVNKEVLVVCMNEDDDQSLMVINGASDTILGLDALEQYDFEALLSHRVDKTYISSKQK